MKTDNKITLKKIRASKGDVGFEYEISGEWEKYFRKKNAFFAQYGMDVSEVPDAVLAIPFLCDILPLAWLCDAEIVLNELDEDFFASIDNFKQGFIDMYPMLGFKGKITAAKKIPHGFGPQNKSALFFSGGVDANTALVARLNEKPALITIWGPGIELNDVKGWERQKQIVNGTCEKFELQRCFIKSNFKYIFNHKKINRSIKNTHEKWWHGFQHGLGLIGLAAPYAYIEKINKIYISSTYSQKQTDGKITCASDPSIDNYVRFCGAEIVHEGFELTRQEKYAVIGDFSEKYNHEFDLQVCWTASGGINCCKCEKCLRTIFGMLAQGYDPKKFGFAYSDKDIENMLERVEKKIIITSITALYWKDIRQQCIEGRSAPDYLEPLKHMDFDKINFDLRNPLKKFYLKVLQALWIYYYRFSGNRSGTNR